MKFRALILVASTLLVSGCSLFGGGISGLKMTLDKNAPSCSNVHEDKTSSCYFTYTIENSSNSAVELKGDGIFVDVDGKTFQANSEDQIAPYVSTFSGVLNPNQAVTSRVIFTLPAGTIGQLWLGTADKKDVVAQVDWSVVPVLNDILGFWDRTSNVNADFGSGLWLKITRVTRSQYAAEFIHDDGNLNPSVVGSAILKGTSKSFSLEWDNGFSSKGKLSGQKLVIDCTGGLSIAAAGGCTFIHGVSSLGDYGSDFSGFTQEPLKSVDSNGSPTGLSLTSVEISNPTFDLPMYLETILDSQGNQVDQFILADMGDTTARIWWGGDTVPNLWILGTDVTYTDWGHTGSGTLFLSIDCSESPNSYEYTSDGSATRPCDFRRDYTY